MSLKPRRRGRGQGSRSDERSELALEAAPASVAPTRKRKYSLMLSGLLSSREPSDRFRFEPEESADAHAREIALLGLVVDPGATSLEVAGHVAGVPEPRFLALIDRHRLGVAVVLDHAFPPFLGGE